MLYPTASTIEEPVPVLGCDVGKEQIALFDSASGHNTVIANTPEAIAGLLAGHAGHIVVLEATGGYEIALADAAHARGHTVYRLHPSQAWAFRRSLGLMAKTDSLDAYGHCQIGLLHRHRLRPYQPARPDRQALRQLVERRDELVGMRTAETNRSKAPQAGLIAHSAQRHLAWLEKEILQIEADIENLIAQNHDLAYTSNVLCTVSGVGRRTAQVLIANLPELGTVSGKQIAALAGLAPYARDSGYRSGPRHTGRGRRAPRRALYMACLAALRFNPAIKTFYNRLRANGKNPKTAIIAAARKLIVILNAKIRDEIYKHS
jgi:transposase